MPKSKARKKDKPRRRPAASRQEPGTEHSAGRRYTPELVMLNRAPPLPYGSAMHLLMTGTTPSLRAEQQEKYKQWLLSERAKQEAAEQGDTAWWDLPAVYEQDKQVVGIALEGTVRPYEQTTALLDGHAVVTTEQDREAAEAASGL
jgi:hypothetical protein